MNKCFFHVDLDAFFASVEVLLHPEWKGKPVIVGGIPGDRRAVVSTASYEARKYGVHSAMPLARAVELCPDGIYTRGNYKVYGEYSEKIMAIFSEYSPDVRQISIDEAFLDMTGTERLFGNPIECARGLKKRVFDETGLTVSVGIAATAYIAKISSGLKKPDGLYAVPFGEEEKFMLGLPLEKVWGIGGKTLERLNASGFNSTADIRKHSKQLLAGIFGEAQAAFLYNVVRGLEPPGFLSEAKSHSSGIESTYEYDLTEWNAIERALLDLSEQLMFRLLRENVSGKTVCVKIRYDDFTTISAQESSVQSVTSVEDLYSRALKIFRKKYTAGRGIRLLGITVNNTSDADSDKQNELFDFGEKKRRAIEKSILKLEQKNPSIQIHKARLLTKGKAFFLALTLPFFLLNGAKNLFADETNSIDASGSGSIVVGKDLPPEKESPGTKFLDYEFNDKQVEFFAQGYWDAKLRQTITATFGWGNDFSVSASTPVFEQNVDMSLWFMLNKHWFIEASFADEFKKNTFALGYTNGQGYFKELRVSNRNIIFPSTYSVDDVGRGIGGSDNQAPGVSTSFADPDGKWTLDAALRYDMLTSRDRTYYGHNSVNDSKFSKSSYMTGRMFVLPSSKSISDIEAVFVESFDGGYSDGRGRKFKKLSADDFLLVPSRKMLLLASTCGSGKRGGVLPAVAVKFGSDGAAELSALLPDFLKNVQDAFGSELESGRPVMEDFYYNFWGSIEGSDVLYVQHPEGFSPFAVCFRYDLGARKIDELLVVHSESEKAIAKYAAVQAVEDLSITSENYFSETHYYADVYDTDDFSSDYAEAKVRFPFSASSPGCYLGYGDNDDIVLRSRNFTPVQRFDIGTDAVSGTVMVYKNGVLDPAAQFNKETGEVRLSSAVSDSDKIYIVWFEDSSTFQNGAIAGAAGFNYNWTERLSGDVSLSSRWTLSPETNYAEAGKSYFGYGTLTSRIRYSGENLKVQNTISGTVENNNTTGYYKLLSFDDEAAGTNYNPENAARNLPDGIVPLDFLDINFNASQDAENGLSDGAITGYKIPVRWNFSGNANEWAANTILIQGASLSSCSTFSVALKSDAAFSGDVYLQLGVNGDEDFKVENNARIPVWKISDGSAENVRQHFDASSLEWQTVTVILSDSDRAKCAQYHNARIILVNSAAAASSGAVYFGPYEAAAKGIFTLSDDEITVTSAQVRSSNPAAARFNKSSNYAEEVDWTSAADSVPDETRLTMYKYFQEADSADYSEINLCFKYSFGADKIAASFDENDDALTFILDTDSESIQENGRISAMAAVKKGALLKYADGAWHLLTIKKSAKAVYIDGGRIDGAQVQLNDSVVPTRAKIVFDTSDAESWHKSGEFFIDEIYFSKTSVHFIVEDRNSVEYKKDGDLITTKGGYSLFRNLHARAESSEGATIYTQEGRANKGAFGAAGGIEFTLADINIAANLSRETGSSSAISAASHKIATDVPIAKSVAFSEEYNFNKEDESAAKINSLKLNLNPYGVPLVFSGKCEAVSNEWSLSTNRSGGIGMKLGTNEGGYSLKLSTATSQKLLASRGTSRLATDNYFATWLESTKKEFSFGEPLAARRSVEGKIANKIFLPWNSFSPEINFSSVENYTASKNIYDSDKSSLEFVFPFKIQSNSFSFAWKKSGGQVSASGGGGNYGGDINSLLDSYSGRGYFFAAGPFYDLISARLADNVGSTSAESEYYSGEYSFTFSRPIYADRRDFFVPSTASLILSRDIRAAANITDNYQTKAKLGWTAFNIFGKNGTWPLSNFFETDEYISSLIWTLKIPRETPWKLTQVCTSYIQANFYITNSNILKNGFQFEFQDRNNFSVKTTVLWQRPGKVSPLLGLARLFSKKLREKEIPVTRSDSLNCSWKKSADLSSSAAGRVQRYEYAHSADFAFAKFLALTTEIDLGFECIVNEICRLTATWSLGGKLNF